jgi:hypothetical protein
MRSSLSLRFALLACALPALAACGVDDDETVTSADVTASTGVTGDTTIGAIPTDKRQAVCDALLDYTRGQISEAEATKVSCVVAGILNSGAATGGTPDIGLCNEAYEACLAAPAEPDETPEACALANAPADCDVTVDQLEACAEASALAFKTIAANLSGGCALVANPSSLETAFSSEEPEECASIKERCPGITE